jgi:hypothetical protein
VHIIFLRDTIARQRHRTTILMEARPDALPLLKFAHLLGLTLMGEFLCGRTVLR